MFVSSWILKFYVKKKKKEYGVSLLSSIKRPKLGLLFSQDTSWSAQWVSRLVDGSEMPGSCLLSLFPFCFVFFFSLLVSAKITCMNLPHTWLMNPTTAKERDRQGEEGPCQLQPRFPRSNSQRWTRKGMMKLRTEGCINTHVLILLLKLFAI